MKNLVIGNTSQLSHFFPDEYEKISSRNINFDYYASTYYNRIFFTFGENRTFIENDIDNFIQINVAYTLYLLLFFKNKCNKLIIYGTSELWNKYNGEVSIDFSFWHNSSPYILSKLILVNAIKTAKFKNVIIIHPFNFNSKYRKGKFLFGKINDSISKKKQIEIGDTNFNRDIVSPEYVVERSIKATSDELVGSGKLINIKDHIKNMYIKEGMIFEDYVTENYSLNLNLKRNEFYSKNIL